MVVVAPARTGISVACFDCFQRESQRERAKVSKKMVYMFSRVSTCFSVLCVLRKCACLCNWGGLICNPLQFDINLIKPIIFHIFKFWFCCKNAPRKLKVHKKSSSFFLFYESYFIDTVSIVFLGCRINMMEPFRQQKRQCKVVRFFGIWGMVILKNGDK